MFIIHDVQWNGMATFIQSTNFADSHFKIAIYEFSYFDHCTCLAKGTSQIYHIQRVEIQLKEIRPILSRIHFGHFHPLTQMQQQTSV